MNIRLTLVILLFALPGSAYSDVSNNPTIGEIRGRLAQLEQNDVPNRPYRTELHAYISGIQVGYRIAFQRHIWKRGAVHVCTFIYPERILESALEPNEENLGITLSDFTWQYLLDQCNVSTD